MKNSDYKRNIIIIMLIMIIILVGICIYLITDKKSQPEDLEEKIEQEADESYSLIDMENTENVEILEGNVKENNSKALLTEKTLLGLRIFNIRLAAEDGMTNFTADVENISGSDFTERTIEIVFIKQDGSELERLPSFLPDIKSGETNRIDSSATSDMTNAYNFRIE